MGLVWASTSFLGFEERFAQLNRSRGVEGGRSPPPPPPFATTMLRRLISTRFLGFEARFARLKEVGGLVGGAAPPICNQGSDDEFQQDS